MSLEAIVANWRTMARFAGVEAAGVLKADAYGHGASAAARALAAAGCRSFFAASVAEAVELREALGPGPTVYILNGCFEASPDGLAQAGLTPVLNTLEEIAGWAGRGPWAVHLDTGMNRLGLPAREWGEAARLASASAPELVMSHLSCADAPDHPMNRLQLKRFREGGALFAMARRSLAASAGTALGSDFVFDLTRPGLALFGAWDSAAPGPHLIPAMRLEAPILQLRWLQPGECVGYGCSYQAKTLQLLATVAAGYADGCLRSLADRGYGAIGGVVCPIRGRISMDLITLDVTAAGARAELGATVELLGPTIPAEAQAALAGTVAYELLTQIGAAAARAGGREIA